MNALDVLLVLFVIASLVRGHRIGLVRQIGSTLGFLAGLFAGSWVSAILIGKTSSLNEALGSMLIVLTVSLLGMTIGELAGLRVKSKLLDKPIDGLDRGLGSFMGAATLLFGIWLICSLLVLAPPSNLQRLIKNSHILAALDRHLPPATTILSSLNRLVDPNGFPEVFRGLEPNPDITAPLPDLGSFNSVVAASRASVVRIEGAGCGGIVEGSGFVYADGIVATNAHVVAGVAAPKVRDANGLHDSQVIWFNKDMDVAVLRVHGLAGTPLPLQNTTEPNGTPAVVLGYPGGGSFDAQPSSIVDRFTAIGRDIYGQGTTSRDVYSLHAKVIPGNSGGPVLSSDGAVIGIVFATSTQYNTIGYALTGPQVVPELTQAAHSTTTHPTGLCSE